MLETAAREVAGTLETGATEVAETTSSVMSVAGPTVVETA
jgi:hypothetical protein